MLLTFLPRFPAVGAHVLNRPSVFVALIAGLFGLSSSAADWPQWCGTNGKNMVSFETGLPATFEPGQKRTPERTIDLSTAQNVVWGVKLCDAIYSTPSIAAGRVYVGGVESRDGVFFCLDAADGKTLWQWRVPPRQVPKQRDGFDLGIHPIPAMMGVCATAAIDGDRVFFVDNRFDLIGLAAGGDPASRGKARTDWTLDLWEKYGVFPCDASNGSPVIDGELLYVQTCNGVDRNSFQDTSRERNRPIPNPSAPNLIAVERRTGRLVATDDAPIGPNILHGQWSSPSLGQVGSRKLVFYGGGDGRCYAFEALDRVPETPARLKTVWSFDCIPEEYKTLDGLDAITRYCLGDRRVKGSWNKHDGAFVGRSEIIGTPVILDNRVYVAIGRDPEHGRGRGALHCIDATGAGDITRSGKIWTYQGLDRTLATVSVGGGLVYILDVAGRVHCLDQATGTCYWVLETKAECWGSTLLADGKVYVPTAKGLWVLAAGKELKILSRINLGGKVLASPIVANGTLYVATTGGWLWAVRQK